MHSITSNDLGSIINGGNCGENQAIMGANPIQDVHLKKVLNGWIVKVGCQTIVFESTSRMLSELGRYYANPAQVEKEYMAGIGK